MSRYFIGTLQSIAGNAKISLKSQRQRLGVSFELINSIIVLVAALFSVWSASTQTISPGKVKEKVKF